MTKEERAAIMNPEPEVSLALAREQGRDEERRQHRSNATQARHDALTEVLHMLRKKARELSAASSEEDDEHALSQFGYASIMLRERAEVVGQWIRNNQRDGDVDADASAALIAERAAHAETLRRLDDANAVLQGAVAVTVADLRTRLAASETAHEHTRGSLAKAIQEAIDRQAERDDERRAHEETRRERDEAIARSKVARECMENTERGQNEALAEAKQARAALSASQGMVGRLREALDQACEWLPGETPSEVLERINALAAYAPTPTEAPPSPKMRELARRAVEARANDKRTDEEVAADCAEFIVNGPEAPPSEPKRVLCKLCGYHVLRCDTPKGDDDP